KRKVVAAVAAFLLTAAAIFAGVYYARPKMNAAWAALKAWYDAPPPAKKEPEPERPPAEAATLTPIDDEDDRHTVLDAALASAERSRARGDWTRMIETLEMALDRTKGLDDPLRVQAEK